MNYVVHFQSAWMSLTPHPSYSDIMPHYIDGAQRKYFTVVAGHSHNIINSNIMAGLSGMRPTCFLFCFKMTNATFTTFTWRDVSNDRGPYLRIHDIAAYNYFFETFRHMVLIVARVMSRIPDSQRGTLPRKEDRDETCL